MGRFSSRRGKLYDLDSNRSFTPGTEEYTRVVRMFPEAADVMQTPGTMPVDTGSRMAGDEVMGNLDMLLSEIRASDDDSNRLENLVQEARIYLPQRRQELDALAGGNRGGSRLQDAIEGEAALANLGRLQGNVPMPIIRGGERTHTTYRTDGITGQKLVVPYMDPSSPDTVLKTMYGNRGVNPDLMHQSESSMMNAMKLAGYDTVDNSKAGYGAADLAATKNGRTKNIDVMVRRQFGDTEGIPIYTSLFPMLENGKPDQRGKGSGNAQYTKEQILNRIEDNKVGPFTAVESLVDEGVLGPSQPELRYGKILRAEPGVMPAGQQYDQLVMPGYTPEIMDRRWASSPQRVPTAPSSIQLMDLGMALDRLKSGAMDDAPVKYVTNYGANKKGYERLQVKPEFSMKPEAGVIDMTAAYPLTQQLLAEDELRKRVIG